MNEKDFIQYLAKIDPKKFVTVLATPLPRRSRISWGWLFIVNKIICWSFFIFIILFDIAFTYYGKEPLFKIIIGWHIRWFFVPLFFLCVIIALNDLLTYRPLILESVHYESGDYQFIKKFTSVQSLDLVMQEMRNSPPTSNCDILSYERNIFRVVWCSIVRFRVKGKIMLHYSYLLLTLVIMLVLLAYVINIVGYQAIEGITDTSPLLSYIYFVIATFLTIGFGDIHPYNNSAMAQLLVIIIAITSLTALYVGLGIFINLCYAMHEKLRSSINRFVVSMSPNF